MSYADAAKKGPPQPDEEVPHALPEILHEDSGVHSIDSLSSGTPVSHLSYADLQKQAEEQQAAEEEAKREADEADKAARDFMNAAERSARDLESQGKQYLKEGQNLYGKYAETAKEDYAKLSKSAQEKYQQFSREASKDLEKAKKEGKKLGAEAKKEGKQAEEWAEKNKGNPVVVGNIVVVAALAGLLGTQAYRMKQAGTLTWKVAGAWAGVVGLFAVGDYYVSQWLFRNKYPPKQ